MTRRIQSWCGRLGREQGTVQMRKRSKFSGEVHLQDRLLTFTSRHTSILGPHRPPWQKARQYQTARAHVTTDAVFLSSPKSYFETSGPSGLGWIWGRQLVHKEVLRSRICSLLECPACSTILFPQYKHTKKYMGSLQPREGTPGTHHVGISTIDFSLLNSDKYILAAYKATWVMEPCHSSPDKRRHLILV